MRAVNARMSLEFVNSRVSHQLRPGSVRVRYLRNVRHSLWMGLYMSLMLQDVRPSYHVSQPPVVHCSNSRSARQDLAITSILNSQK